MIWAGEPCGSSGSAAGGCRGRTPGGSCAAEAVEQEMLHSLDYVMDLHADSSEQPEKSQAFLVEAAMQLVLRLQLAALKGALQPK